MRTTLLALGLALPLAACGGGGSPADLTDDGYAALNSGDPSTARSKFEDALEGLAETDAGYMRAKMGHIEALVRTDPGAAQEEFLALASSTELKALEYRKIGSQLMNEKAFTEATAVLDAGYKKFPDDDKFKAVIDQLAEAAAAAGDAEAMSGLEGLGYIGD